ncbi:MAG: hypothetical protein V7K27_07140 [Nostoc sp.]
MSAKTSAKLHITPQVRQVKFQLFAAMSTTGYAYADISTSEND